MTDWGEPEVVGQVSSYHFVPELRLRYPLLKDRLVPYLLLGVGPSWIQSKDGIPTGPHSDAQGWAFTASVGGGLEYFITRRFSLNADARWAYSWDHTFNMGNISAKGDISHAAATIGFRVYLFDL